MINKLQAQVKELQTQLRYSEQTRASVEETLEKLGTATSQVRFRNMKHAAGHQTLQCSNNALYL